MHQIRLFVRDYIEEKIPQKYEGKTVKCLGSKFMIDKSGAYSKSCKNKIKKGDFVYHKICECNETQPYCSVDCCYQKCFFCKRLMCSHCYIYKNSHCVYCAHKSDNCDCDSQEYFCRESSNSNSSVDEFDEFEFENMNNRELIDFIYKNVIDFDKDEKALPSFISKEVREKWATTIKYLHDDVHVENICGCRTVKDAEKIIRDLQTRYKKYAEQELDEIRHEYQTLVQNHKT